MVSIPLQKCFQICLRNVLKVLSIYLPMRATIRFLVGPIFPITESRDVFFVNFVSDRLHDSREARGAWLARLKYFVNNGRSFWSGRVFPVRLSESDSQRLSRVYGSRPRYARSHKFHQRSFLVSVPSSRQPEGKHEQHCTEGTLNFAFFAQYRIILFLPF